MDTTGNNSLYPEVISIQTVAGKKMIYFTFDMYNSEDQATYLGYDLMVTTDQNHHDSDG